MAEFRRQQKGYDREMGEKSKNWFRRIAEAAFLFVLVRGVFAALAERGIHPDLLVARLLDGAATVASQSTHAIELVMAGVIGLALVYLLERFVWPRMVVARSPESIATHDKRSEDTPDAGAPNWLGLKEAVDAFCDPTLVARRNQYSETMQVSTERGHEIESEMRALRGKSPAGSFLNRPEDSQKYDTLHDRMSRHATLADLAKKGLADTWNEIRADLCARLVSGDLIAQGFVEPYKGGVGEVSIKPSEWRILNVRPLLGQAVRRDDPSIVVYSGVQIASAGPPRRNRQLHVVPIQRQFANR